MTIMTICFDVNPSGVDLTTRHVRFSSNVSVFPKCSTLRPLFFFSFTRITFNNCKYCRLISQITPNAFSIALCLIFQSVSYNVAIPLISLLAMLRCILKNTPFTVLLKKQLKFYTVKERAHPLPHAIPCFTRLALFFPLTSHTQLWTLCLCPFASYPRPPCKQRH
jgi:hypothetical protein